MLFKDNMRWQLKISMPMSDRLKPSKRLRNFHMDLSELGTYYYYFFIFQKLFQRYFFSWKNAVPLHEDEKTNTSPNSSVMLPLRF